jgi:hypothetical protein
LPESEGALRVVGWKLDEGDGRAIHAPTLAALEEDGQPWLFCHEANAWRRARLVGRRSRKSGGKAA